MKKPDLAFYRRFLDKVNNHFPEWSPGNILYIGNDMLKDIWPAAELEMKTALFAGDKRSLKWRRDDNRCKNLQPDLVLTKLPQLLQCI